MAITRVTASPAAHLGRNCALARRAPIQTRDRPFDVGAGAVLAELDLCLEAGDPQLEADDGARLGGDVAVGRIAERPGIGSAGLVARDEPPDVRDEPFGIVDRRQGPVRLDVM